MKDRTLYPLLLKLTLVFLLLLTSCATPTAQPVTPTPPTPGLTPITPAVTPFTPAPTPITPVVTPPTSTIAPTTPPPPVALELNCTQTDEGINLTHREGLTAGPFYINDQMILMGPAKSVEQAAQRPDISLTPLINCTFSLPNQILGAFKEGINYPLPASEEALPQGTPLPDVTPAVNMEMNLYQIKQGSMQKILEIMNAEPEVSADPNYLVGGSAKSACGDPNGMAGKPFEIEGSPFEIEGSPDGGPGLSALPQAFWDQWAFNQMHIPNPNVSPLEVTGEGVRIGIFDTSPYQLETGRTTTSLTEIGISPPLEITVHHPWELFVIPPSPDLANIVDVSPHGLFVASLAHAAAPLSRIDLYRVLDQHGCGDLFHLNAAMLDFIISRLGGPDSKQPAVMNLSLGVLKPRQPPQNLQIDNLTLAQAVSVAYNIIQMQGNSIASLGFIAKLAYRAGIVVVAAAGNDSVPGLAPFSMELPAAYPFVVGVSAGTKKSQRACYSNKGNVMAPGAESGTNNISANQRICTPWAARCPGIDATATPGSCDYGVVGLFKPLDSDKRDFAYWVGTSFATPLISGKAALEYASGSNIDQVYNDLVTMFPFPP